MDIFEFLQYGFIQRAIIAGSFIALLCSTLGVMLVLRRLSLIGDGLAHVTFGSVALGLLLRVYPLYASIPLVILGSLGVLRLMERAKLYGDAAIGLVSSLGIAGGVILASVAGGFNVDLFSYLFGNILAISESEVIIAIILSLTVLLVISLYYNELFSLTFDEEFAKTSGINTEKLNTIVIILAAVTVVLTMRVVGIMLTSALLIIPAVTALQLARSFRTAMVIASVTSVLSVILGIGISFAFDLPTGAVIVIVNFIFFTVAYGCKRVRLSD